MDAREKVDYLRKELKNLADDAISLRRSLERPQTDRVQVLESALASILGNAKIWVEQGSCDVDAATWIVQRIEGVL